MNTKKEKITIIGAGNIGMAIAKGLANSKNYQPKDIILTRRHLHLLDDFKKKGFAVTDNNCKAVKESNIIIIAVEPQQLNSLLTEISNSINIKQHLIISVVSGASVKQIKEKIGKNVTVIRAMPNTAIAVGESMTCIAALKANNSSIQKAKKIFETVGKCMVIEEEQMTAATALGACGIAFFLRAIRAASQGGIEIGFRSDVALTIAAQTAKGAATIMLNSERHPEFEIDKVTTPRGCTISGLNHMEHEGFSSAMIKGITVSAEKAAKLYQTNND
ncbi:MAG: pyrroline-5-carboxylate reductase [Ignavibacteriales bacterium]|nr:pyrroline-5-carboxylate reductase [Ignavibacteriales bacterium]